MQVKIPDDKAERLRYLERKLHITPRQQVLQAIDEYFRKFDFFVLAGGSYPPGIKNKGELLAALQDDRSSRDNNRTFDASIMDI